MMRRRRHEEAPFYDLSDDQTLRHAAKAHSRNGDIIVLLLNAQMAATGFNFVAQLKKFGLAQHLLLAPSKTACTTIASAWRALAEHAPACGWAGAVAEHEGWQRYRINATSDVLALYASRWYLSARLTELGYSVLVLDVDAALFADVPKLLRARPLADYDIVLTDQGRGSGINCGFVWFNTRPTANQRAPFECALKRRGEVLRDSGGSTRHGGCVGPARWLARAVWERFELFLSLPAEAVPISKTGAPNKWVLWEQDLWNDVLRSIEVDRHVHPWNCEHGRPPHATPLASLSPKRPRST